MKELIDEQRQYIAPADKVFELVAAGKSTAAADFQQYQAEPILIQMTTTSAPSRSPTTAARPRSWRRSGTPPDCRPVRRWSWASSSCSSPGST